MTDDSGPAGPNRPDAVPAAPPAAPSASDPSPADASGALAAGEAAASGRRDARRSVPGWSGYRARRAAKKRAKASQPHRKAPFWELVVLVAFAVLIAVLVKTFVVQPFYIPSESMEKTLHGCTGCHGDRILVNKLIYDFRDPHPGDIVVFDAPPGWNEATTKPPSNPVVKTIRGFGQLIGFVPPDGQVLVKRVIATGGQTVKGDSSGAVMVSTKGPDGPFRTLKEPYTYTPGPATQRAFGPVT